MIGVSFPSIEEVFLMIFLVEVFGDVFDLVSLFLHFPAEQTICFEFFSALGVVFLVLAGVVFGYLGAFEFVLAFEDFAGEPEKL